jgi:hypothetical protein
LSAAKLPALPIQERDHETLPKETHGLPRRHSADSAPNTPAALGCGRRPPAEDYRGKRIRFSAALKANNVTDGWGGLWLRVDGPRLDEMLAIDTMEDRPLVGTTGWQQHALVLEVAAAATISFGAGLSGEGELPVSKLAFEEVGSEVPVTAGPHRPRHPQNLDFSQA